MDGFHINKLLLVLTLLSISNLQSQEFVFSGEVAASGIISNQEDIPFWMYTNTGTARGNQTNFNSTLSSLVYYTKENVQLRLGVSGFYRDGVADEFQRKEIYLEFQNRWLKATLGAKERDEQVMGLSATNKNFLWSGNARSIPGLLLQANQPVRISQTFSLDWGIGHYQLNDDRYVPDVNIHYKHLALIVTFNENSVLTAKIQHFAQWGGNSPDYGDLPTGLKAFSNVFFALKAVETGTEPFNLNRVGNHLGSYFVEYEFGTGHGRFSIYHEHPFEDASGTRFDNFPDGVWGLQYTPHAEGIIKTVLYEYLDTSDQSGVSVASGIDGYFGNNVYRSGWSYEKHVIGIPFIVYDRAVVQNSINSPYVSNRSRVHHLGVAGIIRGIDWKLKTSFAQYLGTFRKPYITTLNAWYNYLSLTYRTESYGTFAIVSGADFNNLSETIAGGGIEYSYSF